MAGTIEKPEGDAAKLIQRAEDDGKGVKPRKRAPIGFFRGRVREIEAVWWRPMTNEEVDAFFEGRY